MEPKESLEVRTKMAEMHDDVMNRIKRAYEAERYIEVCWLCYACFESRVARILKKICPGCGKPEKKKDWVVGIRTKLQCIARLIESGYPLLQGEDKKFIDELIEWCRERNDLVHGMVTLEQYDEADRQFKKLAGSGKDLVEKMYLLGTDVREYYYKADEIPRIDPTIVNKCRLTQRCIKLDDKT